MGLAPAPLDSPAVPLFHAGTGNIGLIIWARFLWGVTLYGVRCQTCPHNDTAAGALSALEERLGIFMAAQGWEGLPSAGGGG
jgi:hypothetical protein